MVVVAVHHLDVHAGLCHAPRDLAELARLVLPQSLREHLALGEHGDAGIGECRGRRGAVVKEKVRDAAPIDDEHAAAFDADTGASEGVAHVGQGAGAVVEENREVFHRVYDSAMRQIILLITFALLVSGSALAADLTGNVVDMAGKPVRGAHVYVYAAFPKLGLSSVCPNCYRDCGKHEPVDKKGAFRVKAVDETLFFDVLAVADGYEPAFARRTDPNGAPVKIELQRRSAEDAGRLITGVVLDPKGKPVIGAVVEPRGYRSVRGVGYGNLPGLDKLSITNAKGEFALRMPDAGAKLDVRVTARALAPHIDRMLVPGERRTIRLVEGTAITGHIERDGQPVAGARVEFVQRNRASSNYLGRAEIATNEAGFFMMTSLAPNEEYLVSTPDLGVSPALVKTGADGTSIDAGTLKVVPDGKGELSSLRPATAP